MSEAHDAAAERTILGVMFRELRGDARDTVHSAFMSIEPDDWYQKRHADLAAIMQRMVRERIETDPTTVLAHLQTAGMSGTIDGPFLLALMNEAWNPGSVPWLVTRIKRLRSVRKTWALGTRTAQVMESITAGDDESDHVLSAVHLLEESIADVKHTHLAGATRMPTSMHEFLAQPDHYDWVVPELLERQDRIVITGTGGVGKTTLLRQIGAASAAGLHPFGGYPIQGGTWAARVLVIDCEMGTNLSRRKWRDVIGKVDASCRHNRLTKVDWKQQLFIEHRPAGIDLLRNDAAWVENFISAVKPDILLIGPVYKLHHSDPNDEQVTREILWVLDGFRERFNLTMVLEAHPGKGTDEDGRVRMAPIGSSVWMRWPEFGFGVRRSDADRGKGIQRPTLLDVVPWRCDRDEREWPARLQMGQVMPWVPVAVEDSW